MKTLLLLRHGKSRWDRRDLSDHERPLKRRGKRVAKRVGRLLAARRLTPDRLLSSTAKRARATAKRVAKASGFSGEMELLAELYMAQPAAWIDALRLIPDDSDCVLVVGHNPGLEELLEHLTEEVASLPTAALACVSLPLDRWSDLTHATRGRLMEIWRSKELTAAADAVENAK